MRNPEKLGFFFKPEKNRPSGFDTEGRCFHWTVGLQLVHHIHCYCCLWCLLWTQFTKSLEHTFKIMYKNNPSKVNGTIYVFKIDTCLNVRQDEAHNPLKMLFSSCSSASENTYSHRAIHNTIPILSLWHSFQAIRPRVHREDDSAAHWRCRPPWALFAGSVAESAVLRKMYVLGEGFGTNAF